VPIEEEEEEWLKITIGSIFRRFRLHPRPRYVHVTISKRHETYFHKQYLRINVCRPVCCRQTRRGRFAINAICQAVDVITPF
jgi:hypothetical protein